MCLVVITHYFQAQIAHTLSLHISKCRKNFLSFDDDTYTLFLFCYIGNVMAFEDCVVNFPASLLNSAELLVRFIFYLFQGCLKQRHGESKPVLRYHGVNLQPDLYWQQFKNGLPY